MFVSNDTLKKILIDAGMIDEETWADALKNAGRLGVPIEDILKERDIIAGHLLYELVASSLNLKYVNLKTRDIPDEALALFDTEMVGEYKAIPFEVDAKKKRVKVAFLDPTKQKQIKSLEKKAGYSIDPYFCGTNSFQFAAKFYQKGVAAQMKKLIEEMIPFQQPRSFLFHPDTSGNHKKLFEKLIEYVYYTQPSDVHIEHVRDGGVIKFRVDGFLRDEFNLPKAQIDELIARVKADSGLSTDAHHQTRDGRFSFTVFGEIISFRVSVMPTYYGEKICARVLNESHQKTSLSDLGFTEGAIKLVKREIKKPYGLMLVTGPTGSGKSSTLYTLLKSLNVEGVSIATIEDPVEYSIKHVNQAQVDGENGFTFASGLRAILRQDPNVIMVGEIRDAETAGITIQSALTGHIVLSTLHSNTAVGAITRLKNMDIRSYLLAPTVNIVVNQRLVKGLCPSCRQSYTVDKKFLAGLEKDAHITRSLEKLKKFDFLSYKTFADIRFYRGVGCGKCHGKGTLGRVGVFEILTVDEEIRDAILKDKPESAIQTLAESKGMLTLFEDGLIKVLNGATTIGEVMRVIN